MLAALPDSVRGLVAAGSDRLVELEQELHEVRQTLTPPLEPGTRKATQLLIRELKRKIAQ